MFFSGYFDLLSLFLFGFFLFGDLNFQYPIFIFRLYTVSLYRFR